MDLALRPRTENAFSSDSSAPTRLATNQAPALDCRSPGGSWISITAGSWRVNERGAARQCSWTFRSYAALKYERDIGRMFNIATDHAIGLYFGLLALPLALIAIRLRPARHIVPGTVLAASVLMAMSGAIHLGLISTHREEPITALLFLLNGVAYILLSVAFTWPAPPMRSTPTPELCSRRPMRSRRRSKRLPQRSCMRKPRRRSSSTRIQKWPTRPAIAPAALRTCRPPTG